MRRRKFIKLFGGALIAWPVAARAQQSTTKIPRIGWLVTVSPSSHRLSLVAFHDGVTVLGYVEGQNISIEYRWAEGNLDRLPELANDLVQQKVDVILAGGTLVVEVVKRTTSTIPIVAAGAGDLAEVRLVASLARPGGNLTGFVASAPEIAAKRLEIMRELKPQARRTAVLANLSSSIAKLELGFATQFASANGFDITLHDAHEVDELKRVLTNLPQSNPDVLVVLMIPSSSRIES